MKAFKRLNVVENNTSKVNNRITEKRIWQTVKQLYNSENKCTELERNFTCTTRMFTTMAKGAFQNCKWTERTISSLANRSTVKNERAMWNISFRKSTQRQLPSHTTKLSGWGELTCQLETRKPPHAEPYLNVLQKRFVRMTGFCKVAFSSEFIITIVLRVKRKLTIKEYRCLRALGNNRLLLLKWWNKTSI